LKAVSDIRSNHNEQIEYAALAIGSEGSHKYLVFEAIYFHKAKIKSLEYIIERTKLEKIKVQKAAAGLIAKGLVTKTKEKGQHLYHVDKSYFGHKNTILDLAKNPEKRKAMVTKRRPEITVKPPSKVITKRALKKQKKLTVLYLTADAEAQPRLRLDAEVRKVQEAIRGSKFRDNVCIECRPAADRGTLVNGLNDITPQILHFSGHSNSSIVAMDDGSILSPSVTVISYSQLSKALAATDNPPRVLILNSCESSAGKKDMLKCVDILISMRVSISDIAAATFAPSFYAAIASGQSVQSAFEQGRNAVEIASIDEASTPEIFSRDGIDPKKVILT